MTQKELLYFEDAIEHERITIDICNYIIDSLDDEKLVGFMQRQLKKHESIKNKLLNKLEECSNG
jgi:ppGpp synthetase/RelA/SpoT-type nucleotidyltranferase